MNGSNFEYLIDSLARSSIYGRIVLVTYASLGNFPKNSKIYGISPSNKKS